MSPDPPFPSPWPAPRSRAGAPRIRRLRRTGRLALLGLAALVVVPACTDRDPADREGLTALMRAARDGEVGEAGRVLFLGASVDQAVRAAGPIRRTAGLLPGIERPVREVGFRPLHFAAREGHEPVVRLLLDMEAEPGPAARNGETPLSLAVQGGHLAIARQLLRAGGDARGGEPPGGRTPLMTAAAEGDSLMIRLLLDFGADPRTRDAEGKTAADYARGAGNGHVVPLLEERGGG